jgi:hypothetical protein
MTRHVHPWVFMVLIIPFGVVSGYITVTLAFQLCFDGVGDFAEYMEVFLVSNH